MGAEDDECTISGTPGEPSPASAPSDFSPFGTVLVSKILSPIEWLLSVMLHMERDCEAVGCRSNPSRVA
eukprot:3602442-Amphidinium_carterae.1